MIIGVQERKMMKLTDQILESAKDFDLTTEEKITTCLGAAYELSSTLGAQNPALAESIHKTMNGAMDVVIAMLEVVEARR